MRSYWSNATVEPHQQSLTDMSTTNNQMSDRGIQTDITFLQKPQVDVSEANSFDDNNLIIKPISPITSLNEEKPKSKRREAKNSCAYAIEASSLWNQRK